MSQERYQRPEFLERFPGRAFIWIMFPDFGVSIALPFEDDFAPRRSKSAIATSMSSSSRFNFVISLS